MQKLLRRLQTVANDETSLVAIAERLRLTRTALGMSQAAFCKSVDIAANTYNQYEKAVQTPRLDMAIRMCRRHRLTLDWIYMGDGSSLPSSLHEKIKELRRTSI